MADPTRTIVAPWAMALFEVRAHAHADFVQPVAMRDVGEHLEMRFRRLVEGRNGHDT